MLRKDSTIGMEDYINRFTSLIQEIDLYWLKEIPKMSTAQINLTFICSLSEKYETFYHSISKDIYTMNTAELFTRIKVINALHAKPDESKTTMLIMKTFKSNFYSYKGKGSYRGKRKLLSISSRSKKLQQIFEQQFQHGMHLLLQMW